MARAGQMYTTVSVATIVITEQEDGESICSLVHKSLFYFYEDADDFQGEAAPQKKGRLPPYISTRPVCDDEVSFIILNLLIY